MKEYEKIENIKKIVKYGTCSSNKILGKDRDCSEICQFYVSNGCSIIHEISVFKKLLNRHNKLKEIEKL